MKPHLRLAVGLIVAAACGRDLTVTGPVAGPSLSQSLPPPGARGITVMTRNLYLGADLFPILSAPPDQVPIAVAQTFAAVQATNFPQRAGKLADEIAGATPHLVGLQEVELYRRQSPGDAINGGTTPATTVVFDFLQLLVDSLSVRGLDYRPVASEVTLDAEAPAFAGIGPAGPMFDDIRITDRNVILARADVGTAHPQGANYRARVPVSIGGVPLSILRGWTSVEATVAGLQFRFVNTHLEVETAPPVQIAQANELLGILSAEPLPVLLVGDFNSAADGSQTLTYGIVTNSGFVDAWAQRRPRDPGFTCCQAADLLNPVSSLTNRIDLVLWRDRFNEQQGRIVGGVHVDLVGETQADRTASGLWPSDHAGVVATLTVPLELARR